MEKNLFLTKNGVSVLVSDKTMEHMAAHQGVSMDDVVEAVSLINYEGPFQMEEVDLGRIVGKAGCVALLPGDEVVFLYRKNRAGRTPFVMGREAQDTSKMVIGICNDRDNGDVPTLFTAFYGEKAPREPWDAHSEEERTLSEAFWSSHALIFDESAVDPCQSREGQQ